MESKDPQSSPPKETLVTRTGLSVVGRRQRNEDSHAFFEPQDRARRSEKGSLVVVADGMGGHAGGDVASLLCVNVVQETYARDTDPNYRVSLTRALKAANAAIYKRAKEEPELTGMGTTCTALVIRGDEATFAHVGDSRAYLVRKGKVTQLTRDHSLADSNHMDPSAPTRLETSLLTRALGIEEDVLVDTPPEAIPVRHGDHFVLCSDGMSRTVAEADMVRIVGRHQPAAACEKLVELAIANGSLDNVTVEIVRVDGVTVHAPGLWERLRALFRGERPVPQRRTTSQIVVARSTPHTRQGPGPGPSE